MRSRRRLFALVAIAVIALAVCVPPSSGADDVLAFLMPVWIEFQPDLAGTHSAVDILPAAAQPLSLRSLTAFRAPPTALPA